MKGSNKDRFGRVCKREREIGDINGICRFIISSSSFLLAHSQLALHHLSNSSSFFPGPCSQRQHSQGERKEEIKECQVKMTESLCLGMFTRITYMHVRNIFGSFYPRGTEVNRFLLSKTPFVRVHACGEQNSYISKKIGNNIFFPRYFFILMSCALNLRKSAIKSASSLSHPQ